MKNRKGLILVVISFIIVLICLAGVYFFRVSNKNVINVRIKELQIKYYPGYNIATAEGINSVSDKEYISPIVIDVTGENFDKLSTMVSELKETDFDFESCDCAYILDEYQIIVNGKYVLSMGNEFGVYNGLIKSKTFDIPNDLNVLISEIEMNYNTSNLYKEIFFKEIYAEKDGEKFIFTDANEMNQIMKYKYFLVNNEEEYETFNGGYDYVLTLDEYLKIYLYDSNIGYLYNPNGLSTFIMFASESKTTLHDYVENIINNSKLDLKNKLNTNVIIIECDGKEYKITDNTKVDSIIKELNDLSYTRPPFVLEMDANNIFEKQDIKVIINGCKYYIPSSINYGNRFFIDSDNTIYNVSGLINTEAEKYIKELVGLNKE